MNQDVSFERVLIPIRSEDQIALNFFFISIVDYL